MAPQRYPSDPGIHAGEISNTTLYGIITETRREVYERLDRQAERTDAAVSDINSGINDIKELLADGQEKFGRFDERIKSESAARTDLTHRVDDLESDVQRACKPTTKKDDSGANRLKIEKDMRVRIFNTLVLAAAAAAGATFWAWLQSPHGSPEPKDHVSPPPASAPSKP